MSNYRTFELTLTTGSFDGTTVVAATGWSPELTASNQIAKRMTKTATTSQGRFTPDTLGRRKKLWALCRVWTNGPQGESDRVEARSSLDTADGLPTDVLRRTAELTLSPQTAEDMLLGPSDDLCVYFIPAEGGGTVHVEINDLSPEELFEWLKDKAPPAPDPTPDNCCEVATVEIDDGDVAASVVTLTPQDGRQLVIATFDTEEDVIVDLPDVNSSNEGDQVQVRRDGGNWFSVRGDINGVSPAEVRLRGPETVIFTLGYGPGATRTWFSTQRLQDWDPITVAAPGAIGPFEGNKEVLVSIGAGGTITLPAADATAPGQELVVTHVSGGEIQIDLDDPATEYLDEVLGGRTWLVNPGDSVRFIRNRELGLGWITTHNRYNQGRLLATSNANVTYTAGWPGSRPLILGATPVTVTLPPTGALKQGCRLLVMNGAGATTVQVTDNATEQIIGLGASGNSVALAAANTWSVFEYVGADGTGQNVWAHMS